MKFVRRVLYAVVFLVACQLANIGWLEWQGVEAEEAFNALPSTPCKEALQQGEFTKIELYLAGKGELWWGPIFSQLETAAVDFDCRYNEIDNFLTQSSLIRASDHRIEIKNSDIVVYKYEKPRFYFLDKLIPVLGNRITVRTSYRADGSFRSLGASLTAL